MTGNEHMTEAFLTAAAELDLIISRIHRTDPILTLERESDRFWIVQDVANDLTMFRCPSYWTCDRFMRTFVSRNPGARIEAAGFSLRVERELTEAQPQAVHVQPALAIATSVERGTEGGVAPGAAPVSQAVAGELHEPASLLPTFTTVERGGVEPVQGSAEQDGLETPAASPLPDRHLTLYRGGTAA